MTKLDEIENRNKNFFSLTCRSFVDDMDYMIKLARKAEEMAKAIGYTCPEDDTQWLRRDIELAREFLSFLENGDE